MKDSEGQIKIPGTATKQEEAFEEEGDGWIKCAEKIADELMKALGWKVKHYNGQDFERGMKLTIKKSKPEAEEEEGGKLPKGKKADAPADGSQDDTGHAPLSEASKRTARSEAAK